MNLNTYWHFLYFIIYCFSLNNKMIFTKINHLLLFIHLFIFLILIPILLVKIFILNLNFMELFILIFSKQYPILLMNLI